MNKTLIHVRLSPKHLKILHNYGEGHTEQLEKALERLEKLEEDMRKLRVEGDKKKQQQLDFLREKERIKTEALQRRQALRPARAAHAQVDWGPQDSGAAFEREA
jgi:hypothetical protein